MAEKPDITAHYSSAGLMERLRVALISDGADPDNPTIQEMAPYDQFHGRGMEATEDVAGLIAPSADDHILDVGSGIGGPARFFADRFGCRVTGIDLTADFCDAARVLTRRMGLDDQVRIEQADALAMPFRDATFNGAYTMNVSMNIEDKHGLYAEVFRVLKPGAWFVLSEIAQGPGGALSYPTPWARTSASSFLSTPEETNAGLEAAGFTGLDVQNMAARSLAYGAKSRAMVERGEKPPHRAVALIHGALAEEAMPNTARALKENRAVPIEIFCRKPA